MLKKIFKKIPPVAIPLIACVALSVVLVFVVNYRLNVASTCDALGENTGSLVGKAIGSFEGLTAGQREGYEAGKEQGLSAEDTTVELSGAIKETAMLQVLVASGTYTDKITAGEEYAAIFSQDYNTIFTVNLETADIELRNDGLYIVLDQPQAEFNPVGEYRILTYWSKNQYSGEIEKGYEAIINSVNALIKEGSKMFSEDEDMMTSARTSAEAQLQQLVKAVSITKPRVFIEWREG